MAIIKDTIRRFVGYLNNKDKEGGFWLPNIQRTFVWKEDQIEKLFDSILREYPIGILLTWKTKSEVKRRKFIDVYKDGIKFIDYYYPEDNKAKILVLDGQQRLQSLFIGLLGSYNGKELYLNILSGDMLPPEDTRFEFKFLNKDKATFPWLKLKEIVFSDKRNSEYKRNLLENMTISLEQEDRIDDNLDLIKDVFCTKENIVYQEIDSIDRPESYSDDDVVEIFIRANSGGTPLNKSDLMFSLLISSWADADEKMHELIDILNKTGYEFSRDFILKTCLVIMNKGAKYNVDKFRDNSTRDIIINQWQDIADAIKDVKDFIYGKTFLKTDKSLPSYLVLIPIIYFRYHFPEKWNNIKDLNKFIVRTMLAGAFSGTPDNLIDKCVRHMKETREFSVNAMFDIIVNDGRNLKISDETLLNNSYSSSTIHLLFNLWYDFNYQPAYSNNQPQIDHIFPQSLLKTIKKISPETGRMSLLKYPWQTRDQIANLMLLTAEENGAGGKTDMPPEEWFSDKSDEYLDIHLIPKDRELWKLENFERFIEARKELIKEKFEYLINKQEAEN